MCISIGLTDVPKLLDDKITQSKQHVKDFHYEAIITFGRIEAETLSDYVKQNTPTVKHALEIAQQLLTIIKNIHALGVIHRDIQPDNILVKNGHAALKLMLFNFDSATIVGDQDENGVLGNKFYRMPQFEIPMTEVRNSNQLTQRNSPTIDATGVCAVLFWLITELTPRESRDINGLAPHDRTDYTKKISKKLARGTSKSKFCQRNSISRLPNFMFYTQNKLIS
jgi:serine/threonine protein kinase